VITEEEVKELRRNYMKCQDCGDVEGCLSHWDEEGALMPSNMPMVKGKTALRELYRSLFARVDVKNTITFEVIGVSEEWSFAQGSYEGDDFPKDGGKPIHEKGKYLEIHRRQPDGSLKFYRHMWSADE